MPPLGEAAFFAALRAFLERRQLRLADLFAALDADLDGGLSPGELRALMGHVAPRMTPSEAAYLVVGPGPGAVL